MDKNHIRKLLIQKRNELSAEALEQASKIISAKILNLECYINAKSIGFYVSINNEADISFVWQHAVNHRKKCYFPKVMDKNSMIFLPGDSLSEFTKNKWGILEPSVKESYSLPVSELNLLLVPLVAFDVLGSRIGMGKGFYDKALLKNNSTILVGVAYEFQRVDFIKSETWDVKLDIIVTEKRVYFV